jgi:hypothetical protein
MKNFLRLGLVIVFSQLLPGCGFSLLKPNAGLSPVIRYVEPVTNSVVVTNLDFKLVNGVVVTNIVVDVSRTIIPGYSITNYITNTVYGVNPSLQKSLDVAQNLNQFNPTPFAGPLSIILGLLSSGLGVYARIKSKQAATLPAIIDAVETFSQTNPGIKSLIAQKSQAAGTGETLHELVRSNT